MSNLTKVVWREWFNAPTVAKLTEMGALPREEVELDTKFEDGPGVAALIAKDATDHGSEAFREETEIVIIEPEEFAGTYKICVDYEPTFTAYEADLD